VPLRTLEKIAREYTKNPGVRHVQRVYDYFCRAEKRERPQ
jgi:ATP-dependent Lon protease